MKKFKMPTAYAILAGLIAAVALSTWIIPAGQYTYVDGLRASVASLITEINPGLSMHDFRITDGENRINLIFDLLVPFSVTAEECAAAVEEIRRRVSELDPRFRTVIKIDTDYTANTKE